MRLPELGKYGITSVSLVGKTNGKGKGIIYATTDAPVIPLNRWEYPEFISKIPRTEGWKLLQKVFMARDSEDIKPIIQRLEKSHFEFHIYTVPTTPPIELVLWRKGSKFIINAVEYGRSHSRLMLYTSFRMTQQMLVLAIAGNIF